MFFVGGVGKSNYLLAGTVIPRLSLFPSLVGTGATRFPD